LHEKYPELILPLCQSTEVDEVQADQQQRTNAKLTEVLEFNPSASSEAAITSASQLAQNSDAPRN